MEEHLQILRDNPDFKKFCDYVYEELWHESKRSEHQLAELITFVPMLRIYTQVTSISPTLTYEYVRWLVEKKIPSRSWENDNTFLIFARFINNNQSIYDSYSRSVESMKYASVQYGLSDWKEYFKHVPCNRLVQDVIYGRISPWMVLSTSWGKKKYSMLNDEQLDEIFDKTLWFDIKMEDINSKTYIARKCMLEGIR